MTSVTDTVKHNDDYDFMKSISIRNLRDVQATQKAYKDKYKVYAHNWETIINFIENDSIAHVDAEGTVPNRKITEKERDYLIQFGLYKRGQAIDDNMKPDEALYLSKSDICPSDLQTYRRDTINVSFIETRFTKNRSYMKERKDNEFGKFVAKDLQYIPYTSKKNKWTIDTARILVKQTDSINNITIILDTIFTFRLEGVLPLQKIEGMETKEIMCMGEIYDKGLTGSWEEDNVKQKLQLPKKKNLNRKEYKPAPEIKQETDISISDAPKPKDKSSKNK